jgi:enamine deaminase RidA (YjgF/YER057c/UK114 family)
MPKKYLNPGTLFPSQQYGFSQIVPDIVSLRINVVGEHIHNGRAVREALLSFLQDDQLPASTWIGTPALASKDFLNEIEAIAVLE